MGLTTLCDLTIHLEALTRSTRDPATPVPAAEINRRPLERKITRVETRLDRVDTQVSDLEDVPERVNLRNL